MGAESRPSSSSQRKGRLPQRSMKSVTSLAYSFIWVSTGTRSSAAASNTARSNSSLTAVGVVTE